jgi:hypothetical protein
MSQHQSKSYEFTLAIDSAEWTNLVIHSLLEWLLLLKHGDKLDNIGIYVVEFVCRAIKAEDEIPTRFLSGWGRCNCLGYFWVLRIFARVCWGDHIDDSNEEFKFSQVKVGCRKMGGTKLCVV